jgi:hypothetical protein
VQFVTLLALSDEGAPCFDRELAANLSAWDLVVRLLAGSVS